MYPTLQPTRAPYPMFDTHFHLDFCSDYETFMRAWQHYSYTDDSERTMPSRMFAVGVRPRSYKQTCNAIAALSCADTIIPGVGFHPWLISDNTIDALEFEAGLHSIAHARVIGEIGIDATVRGVGRDPEQAQVILAKQRTCFERICYAVRDAVRDAVQHGSVQNGSVHHGKVQHDEVQSGGVQSDVQHTAPCAKKILSIHAAGTRENIVDILKTTGVLECATCIFHWFSLDSIQFCDARSQSCMFSVNTRMLASRKGKNYAAQLPLTQLLLETDMPACAHSTYTIPSHMLEAARTIELLAQIKHMDAHAVAQTLYENACALLTTK